MTIEELNGKIVELESDLQNLGEMINNNLETLRRLITYVNNLAIDIRELKTKDR